jgi:hypothetical protein
MSPKQAALSEEVRRAALRSGLGVTKLARAARVDNASMSRFLARRRGLRLAALDRLADVLHLKVAAVGDRKKGGRL